jgi:hypothetical protein
MQKRKTKVPRKKRSPVWLDMSDEDFSALVSKSRHIGDVLNAFGLENVGSNHRTAQERISCLGLDIGHFNAKDRKYCSGLPLKNLLIADVRITNFTSFKRRLRKAGLLKGKCAICGLGNRWRGKRLVLILDHKNGNRRDNRKKNLREVCPNCNSQLKTFAGRNKRGDWSCSWEFDSLHPNQI